MSAVRKHLILSTRCAHAPSKTTEMGPVALAFSGPSIGQIREPLWRKSRIGVRADVVRRMRMREGLERSRAAGRDRLPVIEKLQNALLAVPHQYWEGGGKPKIGENEAATAQVGKPATCMRVHRVLGFL